MPLYAGRVLFPDGLRAGWAEVEGGRVTRVGEGEPPAAPAARGVLVPRTWNMHTHMGDAFLFETPQPANLREAVGPGGFKHRRLAEASRHDLVDAARRRLARMANAGTARVFDFREGGHYGLDVLREAARGTGVQATLLGRPAGEWAETDEVEELVREGDGVGIAALDDVPWDLARSLADAARRAGKLVALHLSEGRRDDVAQALDLKPHFVVHAVHATDDDLRALAAAKVPVVVCPRSNERFGLRAPVERMRRAGVPVLVGSDNAMLTDGDLFAELAALRRWDHGLGDEALLRTVTYAPRAVLPTHAEPAPRGWPGGGLALGTQRPDGSLDLAVPPRLVARGAAQGSVTR